MWRVLRHIIPVNIGGEVKGAGVLFGQMLVVFGIVVAGMWGAAQWTAAHLGYQLRLGSLWFGAL